jgi:hypothetical protein
MKLTPWYPAHITPVRKGVYQQMCGLGKRLGYQHWNGHGWSPWFPTPEQAKQSQFHNAYSTQWRGIARGK